MVIGADVGGLTDCTARGGHGIVDRIDYVDWRGGGVVGRIGVVGRARCAQHTH